MGVVRGFVLVTLVVLAAIAIGVGVEASVGRPTTAVPAARLSCPPPRIDESPPNHQAILADVLVPIHPSGALLCRYAQPRSSMPHTELRSRRAVGATEAGEIAIALDALSTRTPPTAMSCPASFFRLIALTFTYAGRPTVEVDFRDTGCRSFTNGTLSASEVESVSLFQRAADLVERLAR